MSRSTASRALLFALILASFAPVRAFAGCHVAIVKNITPTDPAGTSTTGQITISPLGAPAVMQRESAMERVSDVLIYDDTTVAGGNCFTAGNKVRLSYSGQLTNPATILSNSTYFDVYDSAGASGLGIVATSFTAIAANAPVSVVEITVNAAGTAATGAGGITQTATGSAVRVKNLRFDARTLASGNTLTVNVSATSGMPASSNVVVGLALDTVAPGASVVQEGSGTQSAGATLDTPAIFDFAENYAASFRPASTNASGVAGDFPTTATRVIFDLGTTLPWGVSVNFPAKMQVGGTAGLTLTLKSGGSCNGPSQCSAVYDTTSSGPIAADIQPTTAADPNTGEDGNPPAIGVFIANPSGFGSVSVTVSVVPSHLASLGDSPVRVMSIQLMGAPPVAQGTPPVVGALSPNSVVAGSGATTLTVGGSGFTASTSVLWNGSPRPTTFVSATQLTAAISAADIASAGTASVSVANGTAGSNAVTFTVQANPKNTSPLNYILPHWISGGGYGSKVTIVNLSALQNTVVLSFMSQSGSTLSTQTYSLAPGATLRIPTNDTERFGASVTKWATVGAQNPILANVWYDYIATQGSTAIGNSVGFNDAAPITDFSIPVEFEPGVDGVSYGKTVGLALANPNGNIVGATVRLVDQTGAVVATQTVNIPANGQVAVDLSQATGFGSALPKGNFVGSVTVQASAPVSSLAVQDNNGLFSAVPVSQGRAK